MSCPYHDHRCRCYEPANPTNVNLGALLDPQIGELIWLRHETRWRRCKVVSARTKLEERWNPIAGERQKRGVSYYLVQFLRPINGGKVPPSRRLTIGQSDFYREQPPEELGAEWKR